MKQFTDQSAASRTEKAKRVLRALANPHDYKYFYGNGERMRHTPNFTWTIANKNGVDVLMIVDHYDDASPTMTVTNGAEDVIERIQAVLDETGETMPDIAIYKDTDGVWAYINLIDGKFAGFSPLGRKDTTDRELALDIASSRTGKCPAPRPH